MITSLRLTECSWSSTIRPHAAFEYDFFATFGTEAATDAIIYELIYHCSLCYHRLTRELRSFSGQNRRLINAFVQRNCVPYARTLRIASDMRSNGRLSHSRLRLNDVQAYVIVYGSTHGLSRLPCYRTNASYARCTWFSDGDESELFRFQKKYCTSCRLIVKRALTCADGEKKTAWRFNRTRGSADRVETT